MKKRSRILLGCMVLLACSGCVRTRAYVMEKERVDQEIPGVALPAVPKTRQIIVLEVIEKDRNPSAIAPAAALEAGQKPVDGQSKVVTEEKDTVVVHEGNFSFPAMTTEALTQEIGVRPAALPAEYKVEKDDTLQKIAKKLYGSFNKWTMIYDANKDIIKDPNFLKPGALLKIPSLEQ